MSTITDSEGREYPVYRQGSRWICEGPHGRFFARSKTDAQRLLRETGGRYDQAAHPDRAVREWKP